MVVAVEAEVEDWERGVDLDLDLGVSSWGEEGNDDDDDVSAAAAAADDDASAAGGCGGGGEAVVGGAAAAAGVELVEKLLLGLLLVEKNQRISLEAAKRSIGFGPYNR